MNATTADKWISQIEISREEIGQDTQNFDQIVEVDSAEDSMIFTIIDILMVLVVYLGPVVAFGYLVAPVVARLLRMPISY
ncbi:MAG TPA: hypothetical protein VFG28_09905 [Syntrophales bacterium]|nr:hypothetical protein [Syntrophales bacterium]